MLKAIFVKFTLTGDAGEENNFTGDEEMVKAIALME